MEDPAAGALGSILASLPPFRTLSVASLLGQPQCWEPTLTQGLPDGVAEPFLDCRAIWMLPFNLFCLCTAVDGSPSLFLGPSQCLYTQAYSLKRNP